MLFLISYLRYLLYILLFGKLSRIRLRLLTDSEYFARLCGSGDLTVQLVNESYCAFDKLGVALGHLSAFVVDVVLQSHAQVAAHEFTGRRVYLEQACRFARMAVDRFFQDNPLPRASFKTDHYETVTGADSLALALLEFHAATSGLENVVPANTIDR